MSGTAQRHASPVLYSDARGLASHRVRFVLAEKGISCEIVAVDAAAPPVELVRLNPDGLAPVLIDRDLALHEPRVIVEYLDERYPHPPLMPVDPVSRARSRLSLHRIERDWLVAAERIAGASDREERETARAHLTRSLLESVRLFEAMPFFLSEEFSLLDTVLAPMLWRLPHYGIVLPQSAAPLVDYSSRIFRREAFDRSLTRQEREMRA